MDFGDLAAATKADPKAIVKQVATSSGYQLTENGDTWKITVPIGNLRKQVVSVEFGAKDDEGQEIVKFSSVCGPFSERNAVALLKFNSKIVHGAFALQSSPAGDMIVIQANQIADTSDIMEVTRTLTAVAWQADKAEEKLTGGKDDN